MLHKDTSYDEHFILLTNWYSLYYSALPHPSNRKWYI